MKKIKIELMGVKDGDSVRGTFIRERKRGDNWNREEAFDITSGTPGASREILLDDDERLVVVGEQTHKLVLDRDQNVATFEPADPEEARRKRENDEKIKQQNIAREERERQMTDAQRRAAATPPKMPYVEQRPAVATDQKPRIVEDNRPASEPKPPISVVKQPVPPASRPTDAGAAVRPTGSSPSTNPQGASSSKDVKG